MFKKPFLIVLLLICYLVEGQSSLDIEEKKSLSNQLYTKCFENLNQGSEVFEKYPALKSMKFCSLLECMFLMSYNDPEVQLAATNRLRGIATQLYREGNPVILIMGIESYLTTEKKNKNLDDDNHLVYISYGECTNPQFLSRAAKIVNEQTMLLINK